MRTAGLQPQNHLYLYWFAHQQATWLQHLLIALLTAPQHWHVLL